MSTTARPVGVLGAGSWGTALAIQLARSGQLAYLWGRDAAHIRKLQEARQNVRYLPTAVFPDSLKPEADLKKVLDVCADLLIAAPSHAFREVLGRIGRNTHRVVWATKGFEEDSGKLPHEVAAEMLGDDRPLAVLSGPTFAREVGRGLPTAITLAANQPAFAESFAARLHGPTFRVYTSDDMVGVEVGGAVKNVIAIGAGISDGLGFGANARVALITRGLAEMLRLGLALDARADTFMGLAGMGDLVLTCTDDQSRNRRMGLALAAGKTQADAKQEIRQVVEGVAAARAVHRKARALGVDMPITAQVYRVLYENVPPRRAVEALLERDRKPESD